MTGAAGSFMELVAAKLALVEQYQNGPLPVILATFIVAVCICVALSFPKKSLPPGEFLVAPYLGDGLTMAMTIPIKFFWRKYKKFGPVFKLRTPGESMYAVGDFQVIRRLLIDSDTIEIQFPQTLVDFVGNYDHMNVRAQHKIWRKYVGLALGPAGIDKMIPELEPIIESHLNKWEADGKFSMFQAMVKLSVDMSVEVVAGMKLPPEVDDKWAKEKIATYISGVWALPVKFPGSSFSAAHSAKAELKKAMLPYLEQKVEEILAKEKRDDILNAGVMNMLDAQFLAIKDFKGPSVDALFDNIMGNYLGSIDTTRSMLFATTILASRSPRVMQKLKEEQEKVILERGPKMNVDALQSMQYMEATIKEAMRLMPAANGSTRRVLEPFQVGNYTIPAGSLVYWSVVLAHALDPALWDGSTTHTVPPHMDWMTNLEGAFIPERWLPGSEHPKPKVYLTFGNGSHLCAGMNLAYSEAKLVFASLLRRFDFRFLDENFMDKLMYFPGPKPLKEGVDMVEVTPLKK